MKGFEGALGSGMILSEKVVGRLKAGKSSIFLATVSGEFLSFSSQVSGKAFNLAPGEFKLLSDRFEFKLKGC